MTLRATALFGALVLAAATPAFAQADAAKNQTVYDAEGKRVGKVTRVLDDGSVLVIYKGKVVRIAADSLNTTEDKLATTLTKRELARLN